MGLRRSVTRIRYVRVYLEQKGATAFIGFSKRFLSQRLKALLLR